ncbi:GPI-anchored cell wall beta-1-3-endoglucanase EglC [Venturia nashicola]|uniref:glucan endo-1,3-beta-D-glucosidase n=1 Tax=Venturia nashicola TaxID=86259 RepID=A0A4Z1NVR5_9PEZI|nr:GPI-anchored cell wall beta-1-3-endoglucanase EglC [Venturia nashicola]TLD29718.1 GPI-anchored cell wall beta-1-3-endoglucanase EglC [Venturia nashicola]
MFAKLFALAALPAASTAFGVLKGFNYGSTDAAGAVKDQARFEQEFNTAQNLVGTSGFNSARLYTTIQGGTVNSPISAIPAAISTKTSLLLGIWTSAGQTIVDNEIAALKAAIAQYGTAFTDLIVAISCGSEDLYRNSGYPGASDPGPGAEPDVIAKYIGQIKAAIAGTSAEGRLVGHVDTWTAFINGSNNAVISAADFLGVDAYPYYETANGNDISNAANLFASAYSQVVAVAQGKPVWVTEAGWPVSGPTVAQAVASAENARKFWTSVGCNQLFDKTNVWWFQLDDYPTSPNPAFGVVGTAISTTPLFDLSCPTTTKSRRRSNRAA